MFFILAFSKDAGQTWENEYHRRFEDGASAQAEAKRLNDYNRERGRCSWAAYCRDYRYRVRQVLDTDDDNFYAREAAKGFTPLDYDFEFAPSEYALPHFHPDNPKQVRFFDSIEDAVRCRYTVMNLSRFLTSYMGEEDEPVADYLVKVGYYQGDYSFDITQDADLIEWAYSEGPTSCMNDPDEYPLPEPHPVRVYSGGDLAVAYIKRGETCTARAVVRLDKKIFAKVYGHDKLLSEELEKAGYRRCYSFNQWRGARILKIWNDYAEAYLMPYIDMATSLSPTRDGKFFRLNHNRGSWSCRSVDGYTEYEGAGFNL